MDSFALSGSTGDERPRKLAIQEQAPIHVVEIGDSHVAVQVAAVRRIYQMLYSGKSIRFIFRVLGSEIGAPDDVRVIEKRQGDDPAPTSSVDLYQYLTPDYLGQVDVGVSQGVDPDVAIVSGIPQRADPESLHDTKTAPDFPHWSVQTMLWAAPTLFEQAKYLVEQRRKAQRMKRHRHTPLLRATREPFGIRPARPRNGKRPAILIGFHWLEMGGAEKLAFDCVQWALEAGFRVLVVADKPAGQRLAAKLPDSDDVEFIRADAYLPGHKWNAFLPVLIREENVRAIHIHHCIRLYEAGAFVKSLFPDVRIIDSTHIIEHADGGFPRVSGVWGQFIDHHHVISRELADYFLDTFGAATKVKLGRMLPPAEAEVADPSFHLKAGQKSLRLIFVGRMVHQKRAPLAIEIAVRLHRRLRKSGISVHLDMVGTGPYLDVVRRMAARKGLANNVTFHAPDADVPGLFDRADTLLLPSSNEGLALVSYEAIKRGVIPLSTRVGGQDELVPEAMLLPTSPLACVRGAVKTVRRLLKDPAFLAQCQQELTRNYRALGEDPTAQEAVSLLYRDILKEISEQ